jgi:hypothetical protein
MFEKIEIRHVDKISTIVTTHSKAAINFHGNSIIIAEKINQNETFNTVYNLDKVLSFKTYIL